MSESESLDFEPKVVKPRRKSTNGAETDHETKIRLQGLLRGIDTIVFSFENGWKGKMKPTHSFDDLKNLLSKIYVNEFLVKSSSGVVLYDDFTLRKEYACHKAQVGFSPRLRLKIELLENTHHHRSNQHHHGRKSSSNHENKEPSNKRRKSSSTAPRKTFAEHDIEIDRLLARYGTQWKKIASILGRTQGAVKSQHYRKRTRMAKLENLNNEHNMHLYD